MCGRPSWAPLLNIKTPWDERGAPTEGRPYSFTILTVNKELSFGTLCDKLAFCKQGALPLKLPLRD
jgi:hypothetical protein